MNVVCLALVSDVNAEEKYRLLIEGVENIDNIVFEEMDQVPPGAYKLFRGQPIPSGPNKGLRPILIIWPDGTITHGTEVWHPHHGQYPIINPGLLR